MSSKLPEYQPQSPYTPFLRRFTDERALDLAETRALYHSISARHRASAWGQQGAVERAHNLIVEKISAAIPLPNSLAILEALDRCQEAVLALETTVFSSAELKWDIATLSLKEQVDLRRFLRAQEHFLAHAERVGDLLGDTIAGVFVGLIEAIPKDEDGDDQSLSVPLVTMITKPGEIVERLINSFFRTEQFESGLFTSLQDRFYRNLCAASGIDPHDEKPRKPFINAGESQLSPVELVETYLGGTPFLDLFLTPVPFTIPDKARFEHHWIVAPPGAGKSTTLQYLIAQDLVRVAAGEASVVVMESNRDLIKAIEGLKIFAPGEALDGKLVVIDAEDVEWPIALNLFDVGLSETRSYSPAEREGFRNAVLSLYDYIFGALLSAELTSRQHTLFNFTIELLLNIPSATLDTLIDLMQPGGLARFQQHVETLDPDARRFFELKFNAREFDRTKEQVVDRLFAVKRIRTLSRMFSAPRSKFDFFTEMGAGKVILINVPQSLLQEDGVEIVGRFFISMILLAAHKRQLLPREQRLPCFVYIDECQDFIRRDPKIPVILDQARKLNVALVLAHQRLQQLQPYVLDALYGATTIKFAAKVSDAAAHALARDMRTTPDFILDQPPFHFAAFVRGHTEKALSIRIPKTDMNHEPRMTSHERETVRRHLRETYAARLDQTRPAATSRDQSMPSATTPPVPDAVPTPKPKTEEVDPSQTAPDDDWRS